MTLQEVGHTLAAMRTGSPPITAIFLLGMQVAIAACAPTATAQSWSAQGLRVVEGVEGQVDQVLWPFPDRSVLVVWRDGRDGYARLYAKVLDSDGVTAAGWPSEGLCLSAPSTHAFTPEIVGATDSSVFVVWRDQRFGLSQGFVQSLELRSGVAAGWPRFGARVYPTNSEQAVLAACAGAGQTAFALVRDATLTGSEVVHLLGGASTDSIATTALVRPVMAPDTATAAGLCSDGRGGAFVMFWPYNDPGRYHLYAQHVLPSDEVDPVWPSGGREAASVASSKWLMAAVADGAGGLVMTWMDSRDGDDRLYFTRLGVGGAPSDGWPSSGRALSATPEFLVEDQAQLCVPDSEHIYLSCRRVIGATLGDLFVQCIGRDGAPRSAWPAAGVQVTSASESNFTYDLTTDGALGCDIVWSEARDGDLTGIDVFATRLGEFASTVTPWPVGGVVVCNHGAGQNYPKVAHLLDGSLVTVWRDSRDGEWSVLYAGKVAVDAAVPTLALDARVTMQNGGALVEWLGDARRLSYPSVVARSHVGEDWVENLEPIHIESDRLSVVVRRWRGASEVQCMLRDSTADLRAPAVVSETGWTWPRESRSSRTVVVSGRYCDLNRRVSVSALSPGAMIEWSVFDVMGRRYARGGASTSAEGAAAFDIDLPADSKSGLYFVVLSSGGGALGSVRLLLAR